jgi:hypothetical protein
MVEQVLRGSSRPLRLIEIKARLPRKIAHPKLREALEHYKRLGCVAEGPKGVLWTRVDSPADPRPPAMDLSTLPAFRDEDPDASLRHDECLHE